VAYDGELERELRATLAARAELGEEYEPALVSSFMEKVDRELKLSSARRGSDEPYPSRRTNGFAIASLVLSLVWGLGLGSLLAVIFGVVALHQIEGSHGWQRGRGLAIAGLVIGVVSLLLLAVVIVGAELTVSGGHVGH
jgi:hypothetical protein